ncbi:DUF680 domain-containing protein [Mesorhizobium sp. 131-2-1]|uniref:DUF680 domain-containing protein n=1 Tax=Mesorhizobium sp. 131-2-1 TaxID=2744518 RepID=UPI001928598E|nr:DUF680 domain-containing protein [Mesorhizobium sp. 131-2-1]BCG95761.1 hypothetical protein MesoLj131a_46250 [Mesorhizobium sp. 131-2-1]
MSRIAFITATMLVATSSAFAGSDHYGSNNASQRAAKVDHAFTASIRKQTMTKHAGVDMMTVTDPATTQSFPPESGQGIWGN